MTRAEEGRTEFLKLLRAVPFRPFVVRLESGEEVVVEHPENVAYSPGPSRSGKVRQVFCVLTDDGVLRSSFGAITSLFEEGAEGLAG